MKPIFNRLFACTFATTKRSLNLIMLLVITCCLTIISCKKNTRQETSPPTDLQQSKKKINTVTTGTVLDFNNDGKTEFALFNNGVWKVQGMSNVTYGTAAGDWPIPADYDGDGITDIGVYRTSNYTFNVPALSATQIPYGTTGDIPVPGDYNNDGKAAIALFRPSNGMWQIPELSGTQISWGTVGDIPVQADYDGDGDLDLAVFRPGIAPTWHIKNMVTYKALGGANSIPVPGDYNGDGIADLCVFDKVTGAWSITDISTDLPDIAAIVTPAYGDVPAPGDYFGAGKIQPAVYRPSNQTLYMYNNGTVTSTTMGVNGDMLLNLPYHILRYYYPNPMITVGDVTSNKMEVYDSSVLDWTLTGAKIWSFSPTSALGYAGASRWFSASTDAKLRYNTAFSGATSVAVITSNYWVGLATWTGTNTRGQKLWEAYWNDPSPGPGIHSGELLPNGNFALAAANAGWVRVYNTTVPPGSTYYEVPLREAHSVLWDPTYNVLWACGDNNVDGILKAYIVGGTRTAPTLTEDVSKQVNTKGRYPHDISPYYGDPNKLWISDNTGVWIYNKNTQLFAQAPGAAYRNTVKGISNQTMGGVIIQTKPTSGSYTPTVDFYNLTTGATAGSRTVTGAQFYKGKVFSPEYQ